MLLTRRSGRFAITAVVVAAAAFISGCTGGGQLPRVAPCGPGTGSAASGSRPNIVFILTDDLSTNLVRYMPHVRALAKSGTSFSNFTVTDSLCCPSRTSILTGKYPHNTGVFTNRGPHGGFVGFQRHREAASTFATEMHAAGYRTAMMGKYLNGYKPRALGPDGRPYVPQGWSEWDVTGGGYREFDYTLNQNHQVVHYGSAADDYLTDVLSRRATQFVGACPLRRGRPRAPAPFMLEVATFTPHHPFVPAPRDAHAFPGLRNPRTPAYNRLPRRAPRWLAARKPLTPRQMHFQDLVFRERVRSVQAVDRMIGAIEEALRRAGVADNTVIVFSSDNGFHIGEHRLGPGKMTAFDTDVRVPLVVAGPGIPAGRVTGAVAENIDLAPTFEALAGLEPPDNVDGRSLVPLLHGETPPDWRTAALVEHRRPTALTIGPDQDSKYAANPPSYDAMRTSDYLYLEYVDGTGEFYDLNRDPEELDNLFSRLPDVTRRALHRALVALKHCRASECRAADRAAPLPGRGGTG